LRNRCPPGWYARALDKFFDMNRDKTYGYQFLRPVIIDYVHARLAEGANVSTVRLETAAIRGFFAYMIQMGAVDVMFNPARNVKVRQSKETESSRLNFSPLAMPLSQ
jgi:site-specific recombinase XerC